MPHAQSIKLFELTRKIIEIIPPHQRFSDVDAQRLAEVRDFLRGLEEELVKGFYDTIFNHSPMHAVVSDGARADREKTLRVWWHRTLSGPFDEKYWAWQSLVGMVHIKVGVKNQMMLSMWSWTIAWLKNKIKVSDVKAGHADEILESFERLAMTVQSLTMESYIDSYLQTVIRMTGFKPALLDRMAATEIGRMIAEAREELGSV
ncbi:protoglobin domain-containing protein [Leptothrix ochracea]|uniref:protoglobin domain-containing protein n=1 Tax=Leptothrix ochracea TaxID=735331 RepID=UPI0034E2A6FD